MDKEGKGERALMFLRSDSRSPYSRKLDPGVRDHKLTFVRQRITVQLEVS